MMQIVSPETALLAQRATLITYLRMKLDAEDWHGVQGAASDLREIDARIEGLRVGVQMGSEGATLKPPAMPPPGDSQRSVAAAAQWDQSSSVSPRKGHQPAAVPADDGWTLPDTADTFVRRCAACGASLAGVPSQYNIKTNAYGWHCVACQAFTPVATPARPA